MHSFSKWTDIHQVSLAMDQQNHHLKFGEARPTFGLLDGSGSQTIISRGISIVPLQLNFQIQVSYTLITASSPDCLNAGSSPLPQLQYRISGLLNWITIEAGM